MHAPDEARRQALLAAARASEEDDPDPRTRAETASLIARSASEPHAWVELEERFGSGLAFGTAGLRALLGAGDSRMNCRNVARATAGLCAYLARAVPGAAQRGLCLGFDGRHGSRAFAREARAVAWGAGFVVHAFDEVVPTPVLAFSVRDRGAAGGVMITASHNPAAYNGFKVYLDDGAQLVSPHERGIQNAMDELGRVLELPRLEAEAAGSAGLAGSMHGVIDRYVEAVVAAAGRDARSPLLLAAAYTPLHGVGGAVARRVFAGIGVRRLHVVAEQAEPDPDFPTVAFPNPEEPGALDGVLAAGEQIGAALALAHDPDADRLAVAARDAAGTLAALSGNELGVLLADYLLERAPHDGQSLVVSSIVSSPLLEHVAAKHGARCERTLTGFKWMVARAQQLQREQGYRPVLAFEEALGYCAGELVRDKDGIAAAAHVVCMAERLAASGRTLHQALEDTYRAFGLCESSQRSFTRAGAAGPTEIAGALALLREAPPEQLGSMRVRRTRDLLHGDGELPPSDVLVFELEGDHRITLRPSGTEPKLKVYLDVWARMAPNEPLAAARDRARAATAELAAAVAARIGF